MMPSGILRLNRFSRRQYHGALDQVGQFPDISLPSVFHQAAHEFGGSLFLGFVELCGKAAEKVLGQQGGCLPAVREAAAYAG